MWNGHIVNCRLDIFVAENTDDRLSPRVVRVQKAVEGHSNREGRRMSRPCHRHLIFSWVRYSWRIGCRQKPSEATGIDWRVLMATTIRC